FAFQLDNVYSRSFTTLITLGAEIEPEFSLHFASIWSRIRSIFPLHSSIFFPCTTTRYLGLDTYSIETITSSDLTVSIYFNRSIAPGATTTTENSDATTRSEICSRLLNESEYRANTVS